MGTLTLLVGLRIGLFWKINWNDIKVINLYISFDPEITIQSTHFREVKNRVTGPRDEKTIGALLC